MSESITELLAGMVARQKEAAREHERRMAEDPEYRAEVERRKAEERRLDEEDREARRLDAAAAVAKRRDTAGIPLRFRRYLDAGLEETEALRVAREFLADDSRCLLVLAGPPGVGKTVAAAWFADTRHVRRVWTPLRRDYEAIETPARFVAAMEIVRRGLYGEDAKWWDDVRRAGRLVLDDLGTEPLDGKGYALANLADLLAHRHAEESKTVITSNLSFGEFKRRYLTADGGRLADRFREAGTIYEVRGESMRGPKA